MELQNRNYVFHTLWECEYEHSWLSFAVRSRERSSDWVSFRPGINNSRTMSIFGSLRPSEWSKDGYEKQNNLQLSAHIMHTTCHHLIRAHSSKATPASTGHSSNITSAVCWKPGITERWVKPTIKVKLSLIERTPPKQLPYTPNVWTVLRTTHIVAHVQVSAKA